MFGIRVISGNNNPLTGNIVSSNPTGIHLYYSSNNQVYNNNFVSNSTPKAVILDLIIPGGMGSKETIANLLEIDPGVKAIISSGYSNDPIISNYRKLGFSAVITKPNRLQMWLIRSIGC